MRSAPVLVLALLALAAPATALQTFHLQPDMGLEQEPGGDFEVPVSPWARDLGEPTALWTRTMEAPGDLFPVSGEFTLVVKQPTAGATLPSGDGCWLTAYVGIEGGSWIYYCLVRMDDVPPSLPGEYRFRFETTNPDLDPIPYDAGDVLFFEVTTVSTHQPLLPSLFLAPGDDGATLVLDGTAEPDEAPPGPTGSPGPSASSSAPPAPSSSAAPQPTTSSPPASTTPTPTTPASAASSSAAPSPSQGGREDADPVADAKTPGVGGGLVAAALVALAAARRRLQP